MLPLTKIQDQHPSLSLSLSLSLPLSLYVSKFFKKIKILWLWDLQSDLYCVYREEERDETRIW